MRKINFSAVVLALTAMLGASAGSGYLMAATKATQFSHSFNIHHRRPNPFNPNYWLVTDAGWFAFNPSHSANTIDFKLTAVDNPNFHFGGAMCSGQVGSCTLRVVIDGALDNGCSEHLQDNFLGFSIFGFYVDNPSTSQGDWLQAFNLTATSVSGLAFYLYGPNDDFYVGGTNSFNSPTLAYRAAWQSFDRQIPVTWDASLQRWVAPFIDHWHNTSDYPRGWRTTVEISRTASGTGSYTIFNQNQSGGHGHTSSPPAYGCCPNNLNGQPLADTQQKCASNQFQAMCKAVSVASGTTVTQDAYSFHITDSTALTYHDGQLVVTVAGNNNVGTTVKVRVFPHESAGQVCN